MEAQGVPEPAVEPPVEAAPAHIPDPDSVPAAAAAAAADNTSGDSPIDLDEVQQAEGDNNEAHVTEHATAPVVDAFPEACGAEPASVEPLATDAPTGDESSALNEGTEECEAVAATGTDQTDQPEVAQTQEEPRMDADLFAAGVAAAAEESEPSAVEADPTQEEPEAVDVSGAEVSEELPPPQLVDEEVQPADEAVPAVQEGEAKVQELPSPSPLQQSDEAPSMAADSQQDGDGVGRGMAAEASGASTALHPEATLGEMHLTQTSPTEDADGQTAPGAESSSSSGGQLAPEATLGEGLLGGGELEGQDEAQGDGSGDAAAQVSQEQGAADAGDEQLVE
jgi:hypothetical protein